MAESLPGSLISHLGGIGSECDHCYNLQIQRYLCPYFLSFY